MACVQYPGAHQHWDVNARGGGGWKGGAVPGRGVGRYYKGGVVVGAVECTFSGKGEDVGKRRTLR